MKRRTSIEHAARVTRSTLIALILCCGCCGPILRPQSPEARIDLPPMPDVKYVSTYSHPYGMNYVKVENISLVTGLAGTGAEICAETDEIREQEIEANGVGVVLPRNVRRDGQHFVPV